MAEEQLSISESSALPIMIYYNDALIILLRCFSKKHLTTLGYLGTATMYGQKNYKIQISKAKKTNKQKKTQKTNTDCILVKLEKPGVFVYLRHPLLPPLP